jgi:hypothetical protein
VHRDILTLNTDMAPAQREAGASCDEPAGCVASARCDSGVQSARRGFPAGELRQSPCEHLPLSSGSKRAPLEKSALALCCSTREAVAGRGCAANFGSSGSSGPL